MPQPNMVDTGCPKAVAGVAGAGVDVDIQGIAGMEVDRIRSLDHHTAAEVEVDPTVFLAGEAADIAVGQDSLVVEVVHGKEVPCILGNSQAEAMGRYNRRLSQRIGSKLQLLLLVEYSVHSRNSGFGLAEIDKLERDLEKNLCMANCRVHRVNPCLSF
jgi:hypothetical protein